MTGNPETLHIVGEALYGPNWQTPLADALGVNLRTMQRWAAGTNAVNPNIWPEIAALCQARGAALVKLGKRLSSRNNRGDLPCGP